MAEDEGIVFINLHELNRDGFAQAWGNAAMERLHKANRETPATYTAWCKPSNYSARQVSRWFR